MLVPRTFRFDKYQFNPEREVDRTVRIQSPKPVAKGEESEIKRMPHPKSRAVLPDIQDLFKESEKFPKKWGKRYLKVRSLWHPAEDPALFQKPHKILVGVDETDANLDSLRAALKFAERYGSRLLIAKILNRNVESAEVETEKNKLKGILAKEAHWVSADYLKQHPLEIRIEGHPDPAEGLLQIAQNETCSLIVVGTHPKDPSQLIRLGTVSGKVLRNAPCPVLVWRKPAHGNGLKRVLVPIEGTPFSYQSIVQAIILCEDFGADLFLFHVSPDPQKKEEKHHQLTNLMQKMDWKNVRHDLVTQAGDTVQTIVKFCKDQLIDMVIMGTHTPESDSLGVDSSVTLEVAQGLPCPVLVVHPHLP